MNDPYARVFDTEQDDHYGYNAYYNPEKCGLTRLASLEDPEASYSFDTVIFVKDNATGAVFAAHDSGCSCPRPFEDVRGLSDMTRVRSEREAMRFIYTSGYARYPMHEVVKAVESLGLDDD